MYELSVKYFANREVRVQMGVACSRGKKKADAPALDISLKVQQAPKPSAGGGSGKPTGEDRPGWGTLGRQDRTFNAGSRHGLLEAGAVCDMWHGTNALILTGTLPASTNDANRVLAAYSAYIVNRLNQYCRRFFSDGLWCFYVWEYQKRGALHIHYCLANSDRVSLGKAKRGFHQFWCGILDDLSLKTGVDMYADGRGRSWRRNKAKVQADAQFVDKSVAAYFAKYASKEYHKESQSSMKGFGLKRFVPSRLCGWSRPVGQAMKSCRWSFRIQGDRRSIEKRLDELKALCSELAVKRLAWAWQQIPGDTFCYYFREESLLEIQECASRLVGSEGRFKQGLFMKAIDKVFGSGVLKACFKQWMSRKYGRSSLSWQTALVQAYEDDRVTEQGLTEINRWCNEFLVSRKLRA